MKKMQNKTRQNKEERGGNKMKLREKIIMKLREYGDKQRATRIEKERELIDITLILIEEWREKHDNTKRDER